MFLPAIVVSDICTSADSNSSAHLSDIGSHRRSIRSYLVAIVESDCRAIRIAYGVSQYPERMAQRLADSFCEDRMFVR
jgi:hypothetical protein